MADVNNKLRLQIVTQLDAAGIKATKDQVDQLELGLRRAGNSASGSGEKFGQLEKSLGKLPGRLGEIGGKLGGLAGQATMVFGAFSFGVEIGNKICDQLTKWGVMADPIGDLVKANKEYDRQIKELKESLDEVVAAEMKRFDAAALSAEKGIKAIDDQTAAYFRQVTALNGLKKAEGNAEMLQLERAKFEDMKAYSDAGYGEAAEQIGKYYDVLEAELAAKQQLEEFDRGSVKLAKDLTSAEEAYAKASERAATAKSEQEAAEAALANHRAKNGLGGQAMYDNDRDALEDDKLEKIAERAKKEAEKAAAVLAKRGERLENVDAEVLTRQMERANLAATGTLGVDRAAQAYDNYVVQAGNPLNAEIDQAWAAELLKNSQEADQVQKDILAVVKEFGEKFERLLEVK